MSTLIVHLGEQCARIVTDTLSYDTSGRLLGHANKILSIPHLRCAIVVRGITNFLWTAADILSRNPARDFDGLRPRLRASFENAIALKFNQLGPIKTEAVVVGWSPRERRIVGMLFAAPPLEFSDLEDGWSAGPYDLAEFTPPERVLADIAEPTAASFVEYAELQRAWADKYAPLGRIGGDLVMSTVSESGIRQEIIHSWPDHR